MARVRPVPVLGRPRGAAVTLLRVAVGLACGASCVDGAQGRTVALALLFAAVSIVSAVAAREGR